MQAFVLILTWEILEIILLVFTKNGSTSERVQGMFNTIIKFNCDLALSLILQKVYHIYLIMVNLITNT